LKGWLTSDSRISEKEKYIGIVFALIVIVSIGVVFLYDFQMRAEYMQERIYGYERKHEKAFSMLYLFTEQSNSIYYQQLLKKELNEWLRRPGKLNDDMYRLSVLQNSFIVHIQSHSGLKSIYLHNKKNGLVLSTSFMISDLATFPHNELFEVYYKEGVPSMWVPAASAKNEQLSNQKMVSLVIGIPNHQSSKSGAIALNFDQNYIRNHVLNNSDSFLWLDAKNRVIMADNNDYLEFFNENKEHLLNTSPTSFFYKHHFVIRSESPNGDWKLLTVIPESAIEPPRHSNPMLLLSILLLGLAVPIISFLYLYYSRRVREKWYRFKVESSLPDLQMGFVSELLSGKDIPELSKKAAEYQVNLNCPLFQVIVFEIDDYSNFLITKSNQERLLMNKIIFNAIKWMFNLRFNSYIINSEVAKITVLIGYTSEESEPALRNQLKEVIRYIQLDIKNHYHLTVCCGVSELVNDISRIQEAYVHALQALGYKSIYGKGSVIDYESLPPGQLLLPTVQLEEQLQQFNVYLNQGRIDLIESTVDDMIHHLLQKKPMTLDWLHALFSNLLSRIIKFSLEHHIDLHKQYKEDLFFTLCSYEFLNDKKEYLLNICRYVIGQLNKETAEKNSTAEWIIDYLDKNYDKPISLGVLADKLAMSPSYLSALIKNYLGIGFVEYISRLRIQKALHFLENGDLTIQEIAEQCGYDTIHTFIRQFKKMYKIPPNEYRKIRRREWENRS